MKNIEKIITKELQTDTEFAFSTSDDDLFKRAAAVKNNQQGTKDLVALGMASIWIVFVSILMKILKPIFQQMASSPENIRTNTNNNESN